MSDEAAFLRAIAASADDAPRLVFADWLADRDDPRAAWVRDADIWEWMRPDARDPLPALVATLGDRTDWPRMWRARVVLQKLGAVGIRAIWAWLHEFPEEWPEVRDLCASPPANLRPLAELVARLHADTWEEAAEAAHDLRFHLPDAVLPPLLGVAEEGMRWDIEGGDDDPFAEAIMDTASTFGPAADLMVPWIASQAWWIEDAETALQRIRPNPDVVARHVLCDEDDIARRSIGVVARLSPTPTATLVRILTARGGRCSSAAVTILGRYASAGELEQPGEVVAALLASLSREMSRSRYGNDYFCGLIAESLATIGDRSALPGLRDALTRCHGTGNEGRWLRDELTKAIEMLSRET